MTKCFGEKTQEACVKVINAAVISHLDYHNALLLGIIDRQMHRLQMAQNNAARCLTGTCYRQHISPVLQQLHWLPVRQRVVFKVLTTIHKSLHTLSAPTYMRELCLVYQPHNRHFQSLTDSYTDASSKVRSYRGCIKTWYFHKTFQGLLPNTSIFKKRMNYNRILFAFYKRSWNFLILNNAEIVD